MNRNRSNSFFLYRCDRNESGLACLATVSNFYNKSITLDQIKILHRYDGDFSFSGLIKLAKQLGFDTKVYRTDLDNVKAYDHPIILHLETEPNYIHMVICYGFMDGKYIIGDPEWGIISYTELELQAVWNSKIFVVLKPNETKDVKKKAQLFTRIYKLMFMRGTGTIKTYIGLLILSATCCLYIILKVLNIINPTTLEVTISEIPVFLLHLVLPIVIFFYIAKSKTKVFLQLIEESSSAVMEFYTQFIQQLPHKMWVQIRANEHNYYTYIISNLGGVMSKHLINILNNIIIVVLYIIITFIISVPIGVILIVSVFSSLFLLQIILNRRYRNEKELFIKEMTRFAEQESYIKNIDITRTSQNRTKSSYIQEKIYAYQCIQPKHNLERQIKYKYEVYYILNVFAIPISLYIIFLYIDLKIDLLHVILVYIGLIYIVGSLKSLSVSIYKLIPNIIALFHILEIGRSKIVESSNVINIEPREHNATNWILSIENLSYKCPKGNISIAEINLCIKSGEIICLFSEDHFCKTYLAEVIKGIHYQKSCKIIQLDELNLKGCDHDKWLQDIIIVSNHDHLFPTSILENICLSVDKNQQEKCIKFLRMTGFNSLFSGFQNNYKATLSKDGQGLSNEEKRIISIVRALYQFPKLTILVESTSILSLKLQKKLFTLIEKYNRQYNTAILVLASVPYSAVYSNQIYIVANGKMNCSGTHKELVGYDNPYSAVFRSHCQ